MLMIPRIAPQLVAAGGIGSTSSDMSPDAGPTSSDMSPAGVTGSPADAWAPPAARDTSHDAALFAQYADVDCGVGAIPRPDEGLCEAIPGYAEGMAAASEILRAREEKQRRADKKRGPRDRAVATCLTATKYDARHACEEDRLPLTKKPAGMTVEQCEDLWRDGFAGGSITDERSMNQGTSSALTGGYSGEVGGELDLGGLKIGARGSSKLESTDGYQQGTSRGRSNTTTLRPFKGYQEKCMEIIDEKFPLFNPEEIE